MEPDDWGKVDIFIVDGIVITPDLHSNRDRAVPSLLLAIHTLCRPTDPSEPIAREDCLSLGKLAEEGKLSERFTVLGWDINTRCLTIALPKKKFTRWDKELGEIIARKKVSFALLGNHGWTFKSCGVHLPSYEIFLYLYPPGFISMGYLKKNKKGRTLFNIASVG